MQAAVQVVGLASFILQINHLTVVELNRPVAVHILPVRKTAKDVAEWVHIALVGLIYLVTTELLAESE
jgi:hypothetical protein